MAIIQFIKASITKKCILKICGFITEAQRCSVNCPGIKSLIKKEQSGLENLFTHNLRLFYLGCLLVISTDVDILNIKLNN